ncbi:MAG: 50S ribosomal protein L25/general stress protein Ctc [Gammaproteobacteria bacterium]|nr:50S ribosomal protein L25/general stress protein Ctc [Gammaproteobacteria bacterium]
MTTIVLEAQVRTDMGKGASRRLRRLENKVPGIIYGGEKKPEPVTFDHHKIIRALENERIYASVFDVRIDKRVEHVILKDLHRHPYRPIILHMDLQRISAQDILVKHIPIHFINEDDAPGLTTGGILNHTMTQIEVRCKAKDLPAFIEVDVGGLNLDDVIHLSQVVLPKDVALTIDVTEENHDYPVVSIHLPKVIQEPEPEVEEVEGEEGAEGEAAEEGAEAGDDQADASEEEEKE